MCHGFLPTLVLKYVCWLCLGNAMLPELALLDLVISMSSSAETVSFLAFQTVRELHRMYVSLLTKGLCESYFPPSCVWSQLLRLPDCGIVAAAAAAARRHGRWTQPTAP